MRWVWVLLIFGLFGVIAYAILAETRQEPLETFRFTFPDGRTLQAKAPKYDTKWLLYGDLLVPYGSAKARIWQDRTVIFAFAPDLPERLQKDALAAMRVWSNASVIRFLPRITQSDYVLVQSVQDACFAATGFHGGVQPLNLGQSCSFFQVLHQFGHTLGLQHNHASHIGHQVVQNLYR